MDISSLRAIGQTLAPIPVPVPAEQAAENRQLIQTVKALNATQFPGENREVTFAVDRQTHKPVIRIVDTTTKEVLEQLPAEYILRIGDDFTDGGK